MGMSLLIVMRKWECHY